MQGIYVHVPFCARKCGYCDFYSIVADEGTHARYCDLLLREMDLLLRAYPALAQVPADSVYFGGGTPSLLGAQRLRRLIEAIRSRFTVEKDAEISLEANPGTVEERDLPSLRDAGFTRISLGAQSFHSATLAALGRIHTVRDVREVFRNAKESRFLSVGIDLIFGIPGQEEADWARDLEEAISLSPDHLSAYPLTPEPGTPIHGRIGRGELRLPDDEAVARMYETARERLGAAGYRHYEISNFALPGLECRHNLKYWRRDGYLGLGPSAHGLLLHGEADAAGTRTANPASLEEYGDRIGEGRLPWEDAIGRSREDAWKEHLVFGLRLADGVSLREGEKRYGPPPAELRRAVDRLIGSGCLAGDRDRLRMPEKHWFVSNEVLRRLV